MNAGFNRNAVTVKGGNIEQDCIKTILLEFLFYNMY